ncbi:MAG: CbrC family protein [Chloroflexi bacterium]|nr:CbrC family protein [Chloroflexota bacterium]
MSVKFKYFLNPEQFAHILKDDIKCDICHQVKKCFDGSAFYEEFTAFCFDCVADGRLVEVGVLAADPDFGYLKKQLQNLNPNLQTDEIERRARKITRQLETTTPKFPTWQDWFWPAHCGDYCQFIKLAGQKDFDDLAKDGNGKDLFFSSLRDDLPIDTVEAVWSGLKHGSIKGITEQEDNWSPMAYIFKCLECGEIITIWDCD